MDVLADVFAMLRVGNMIYGRNGLRAPWGMSFERSSKAGFHVVLSGRCWLRAKDTILELNEGDIVLLSHGWTHELADSVDRPALPFLETLAQQAEDGSDGNLTEIFCGAYFLAHSPSPTLFQQLPPIVHIPKREASADLRYAVDQLKREAGGDAPGTAAATSRLVDLVFVYI